MKAISSRVNDNNKLTEKKLYLISSHHNLFFAPVCCFLLSSRWDEDDLKTNVGDLLMKTLFSSIWCVCLRTNLVNHRVEGWKIFFLADLLKKFIIHSLFALEQLRGRIRQISTVHYKFQLKINIHLKTNQHFTIHQIILLFVFKTSLVWRKIKEKRKDHFRLKRRGELNWKTKWNTLGKHFVRIF